MKQRIPYKFSRFCKRATILYSLLILAIGVALFILSVESFYLPSWFVMISVCLLTLYILSIPRYIEITDTKISIHCFVELTTIKIEHITNIRKIDKMYFKHSFPLLGSYGFGGYFGYYFNPKTWNIFKMYASKWDDFVIITDIYEDMYVVNIANADEIIDRVTAIIDGRNKAFIES